MAEYREIRVRRDSTTNWEASNPRLGLGEIGVDMTRPGLKVGNGIDCWNELDYLDIAVFREINNFKQETDSDFESIEKRIKDIENSIASGSGSGSPVVDNFIQKQIDGLVSRITTIEKLIGSSGGGDVSPIALTRERSDRLEHEEYLQEQIHDLARAVLLLTGEIDRLHYHSSNSGGDTTDTTEIEEIIKGILDETIDGETSGDDVEDVINGILNDESQTDTDKYKDDEDSDFYDTINDILNS